MLFNSLQFMWFFPLVLAIYFVIPRRFRYIWLLIASYYFYMGWNAKYLILIVVSTAITFASGLLLDRERRGENRAKAKKAIVAASFVSNLGILVFFKYFDFFLDNLNAALSCVGVAVLAKPFDVLLPVGISFYTFQALGYTADIYRGEIAAERNFLKYALFVSFFPQLVAGPIERSKNLLAQIQKVHTLDLWNYERIRDGAILMLWGYFLKMVVADRAAVVVDEVFSHYGMYGAVELALAGWLFAIQIYGDFCSYSTIAIGAAKIMGFSLVDNFHAPYLARSVKDFWRRWHISLSTWLRDYVYIPLGGSRFGARRRYRNLMVTFLVSGLWNGANWTYVAWGGIHGAFLILESVTKNIREKWLRSWNVNTECFSYRLAEITVTFALVDFAWIFFRSASVGDAFRYLSRMITRFDPWALFTGELFAMGLDRTETEILLAAIVLVFLVDLVRDRFGWDVAQFLARQNVWFAWLATIAVVMAIVVFGEYGPTFDAKQFIYFQF